MSKQTIKELTNGELVAKINKVSGRKIFEVDLHQGDQLVKREIANTEQSALALAQQWVEPIESDNNGDEQESSDSE